MQDPSEVLSVRPMIPTREQTLKTLQEKYPGHISWASDRANFAGCRIVTFMDGGAAGLERNDEQELVNQMKKAGLDLEATPEQVMNLYFSTRANLLVVDLKISESTITILVTTQLDEDDLDEFNEQARITEIHMRDWREKRAAQREAQAAEIRENRRLMEVGKNYEQNIKKLAGMAGKELA